MNALRLHKQVDEALARSVPELAHFVGKRVELIVLEEEAPAPARAKGRRLGALKGAFTVPDDFDAPLPEEIQRAFEGEDDDARGKPRG